MNPLDAGNVTARANAPGDHGHPEAAVRRWSHATVESNHADRVLERGFLTLRVTFASTYRRPAAPIDIQFEVPADFHTHNDSVAAACMTLLSTSARAVTFDFGISEQCATTLRDYYSVHTIGPVDPALEPRRPGHRIALNFSGGLDSFAAMTLLDELIPGEYARVTSAYGERFRHEAHGYERYQRDVTCRTNFREQGLAYGRFNAAVPLLFADYLDLAALVTGHGFAQEPLSIEPLLDGAPPRFRVQEAALEAGGLHELHLMRGLMEPGVVKAMRLAPADRLAAAFHASGGPASSKYLVRSAILRHILAQEGREPLSFVQSLAFEPGKSRFGASLGGLLNALYLVKHLGVEPFGEFWRGLAGRDISWLDDLSLELLTKYNPNYLDLLPETWRAPLLAAFGRRGIEPYNERDWRERETLLTYFLTLQGAR